MHRFQNHNTILPTLFRRCVSIREPVSNRFVRNDYASFVSRGFLSTKADQASSGEKDLKDKLHPHDREMINFLESYMATYGDCNVPTGTNEHAKNERDLEKVPTLVAEWVVRIRKHYRSSKKKNTVRTRLLESMGFVWSSRDANWLRSFRKLRQADSLIVRKEHDSQLHAWVEHQRKTFRANRLLPEREAMLREIGFVFDPTESKWWENYSYLCDYHSEHGNTMVPLIEDGMPNYLGQWVARQRRLYHADALESSRKGALDNLGFSWDPEGEAWDKKYQELIDFHRKYGHTRVPKSMGSLWSWVDWQRKSYRNRLKLAPSAPGVEGTNALITNENIQKLSKLGLEWELPSVERSEASKHRIERLMNVTFELSIHDENWAKHFDKLCWFHKTRHHFCIPPKERELHAWVKHTRYLYHAGKLPQNRVDLLNGIDFAWTAESARWDRLFNELVSHHQQHGHFQNLTTTTELGRWMKQQKSLYEASKNERVSGDRQRLEKLKQMFEIA